MNRLSIAALLLMAASFAGVLAAPVYAVTTITVIGWLTPDSVHFANSMILIIFPLIGVIFFEMILMMFDRKGDAAVHAAFIGLLAGSIAGDLTISNASNNGLIPFGMVVTAGILWALYWWNS